MSRQAKPDGVEVLHYRLYKRVSYDPPVVKLLPNGGMTLAVKWGAGEGDNIVIASSHCSVMDPFSRKVGYDKAVGRFISGRQCLRIPYAHYREFFTEDVLLAHVDPQAAFLKKCDALHDMFNSAWENYAEGFERRVEDYIFPNRWSIGEATHIIRSAAPEIDFSDDPFELRMMYH